MRGAGTVKRPHAYWAKSVMLAQRIAMADARSDIIQRWSGVKPAVAREIYRQTHGKNPKNGQFPYSPDWFVQAQNNLHAAIALGIYESLCAAHTCEEFEQMDPHELDLFRGELYLQTFHLYVKQISIIGKPAKIDTSRIHFILRAHDNNQVALKTCPDCVTRYVEIKDCEGLPCPICLPGKRTSRL